MLDDTFNVSNNMVESYNNEFEYLGNLHEYLIKKEASKSLLFNLNPEYDCNILNNIKIIDRWLEFDKPSK